MHTFLTVVWRRAHSLYWLFAIVFASQIVAAIYFVCAAAFRLSGPKQANARKQFRADYTLKLGRGIPLFWDDAFCEKPQRVYRSRRTSLNTITCYDM